MPAAPALNEQELVAPATVERPRSVDRAFIFWLVLGALAVITGILVLAASDDTIREGAKTLLDRQGKKNPTEQEIKDQISGIRVFYIFFGVVFAALLVAFAFTMRAGKNWARITVAIVGGLFVVLSTLNGFYLPLVLVDLVVAVTAMFLMYRSDAKAFFAAGKASR